MLRPFKNGLSEKVCFILRVIEKYCPLFQMAFSAKNVCLLRFVFNKCKKKKKNLSNLLCCIIPSNRIDLKYIKCQLHRHSYDALQRPLFLFLGSILFIQERISLPCLIIPQPRTRSVYEITCNINTCTPRMPSLFITFSIHTQDFLTSKQKCFL